MYRLCFHKAIWLNDVNYRNQRESRSWGYWYPQQSTQQEWTKGGESIHPPKSQQISWIAQKIMGGDRAESWPFGWYCLRSPKSSTPRNLQIGWVKTGQTSMLQSKTVACSQFSMTKDTWQVSRSATEWKRSRFLSGFTSLWSAKRRNRGPYWNGMESCGSQTDMWLNSMNQTKFWQEGLHYHGEWPKSTGQTGKSGKLLCLHRSNNRWSLSQLMPRRGMGGKLKIGEMLMCHDNEQQEA